MASSTAESPVWALLNTLKSRNAPGGAGATAAPTAARAADIRRAAVDAVCTALDAAAARGVFDGPELHEAAVGARRAPAATAFVRGCKARTQAPDVRALRKSAEDARGHLVVATAAQRRARAAADDVSHALDALDR